MADFRSILNVKAETVEKPKPMPQGTYIATILGHELGESAKNKTPYCRFNFQLNAACEDVDEEQFSEFGGQAKLASRKQRHDFWLTEDSLFRFVEFLTNVVKVPGEGRDLAEMLPDTTGQQVKLHISHRIQNNEVYANIDDFAAIED